MLDGMSSIDRACSNGVSFLREAGLDRCGVGRQLAITHALRDTRAVAVKAGESVGA